MRDADREPVAGQQGGDAAPVDAPVARERPGGRGADDARGRRTLGDHGVQDVQVVAHRREED
jgi:hypothetical protein